MGSNHSNLAHWRPTSHTTSRESASRRHAQDPGTNNNYNHNHLGGPGLIYNYNPTTKYVDARRPVPPPKHTWCVLSAVLAL